MWVTFSTDCNLTERFKHKLIALNVTPHLKVLITRLIYSVHKAKGWGKKKNYKLTKLS